MDKLIFSRKGFDSSAGHGYSPYDPKTGRYIVLPIPGDIVNNNGYKYEDLLLKPNYLEGVQANNLKELIHNNHLNFSRKAREIIHSSYAHYDPVLGSPSWLENGPAFGAFGQAEAAAGHLRNHHVQEGSVFLFFSRFKPIQNRLHPLDPEGGWNKGAYFIYGWLKVGKVITSDNLSELPHDIKEDHPHGSDEDFSQRNQNTIYIASDKLFDDADIPGCGYFPRLNSNLLLSSPVHKNKPSIWKLPSFFNEDQYRPTYLNVEDKRKDRWLACPDDEDYCFVQSTGRGQEFVSVLKDQSMEWLKTLFKDNY
ncbi:Nmad3 family putative nucleotide modification protein [Halobacillus sp. B23F22_1]|uniref:Nmad3 family putative nucleotide modification protein n=1 Tax=Halobacillus sp. B23F22_1 TaxID=3459514 RepID=UPI00373E5082